MKKVTMIFKHYFFVLMALAFRSIALWGSPQRRGRRICRSPQERDSYLIGVVFSEDFMKKLGAKIILYPM